MSRVPGVSATSFEPAGEPVGTALVIPGRAYPPSAPLTFFAGLVLLQHGWSVRQVWWDPPEHESEDRTTAWVREEVERALPRSRRVLLVAKSLGTYAAPLAAERRYDAVWLTPVLRVRSLADAIAANPARQLLVGGTADHVAWDADVARQLAGHGCDVLEVPGADHAMTIPGDAVAGAAVHVEVVRALDAFIARLAG